jgi:hypothetical protein
MEWLLAMSLLAETAARLSHTESASVLYRLLVPYAQLNVADTAEGMRGSVGRYLGILAAMLGHWDQASQYFEEAVDTNGRMGTRPWLAHTQADYGRALFARGERARASELLATAVATYRQLGMELHAADGSAFATTFSTIA